MQQNSDLITMFNHWIVSIVPFQAWYEVEFTIGIVLFCVIIWQRVNGSIYKVSNGLPWILTKISQFGLFIQGMMAVLLIVDAVESSNASTFPKILFILFALGTMFSKATFIAVTYKAMKKKEQDDSILWTANNT